MTTVTTFEGPVYHRTHGLVHIRIHRAVAHGTGTQLAATQRILAVREPGFDNLWAGDVVEIFDQHGALIERHVCGDNEQEEKWTSTLTDSGNYSISATKSTKS